MPPTAARHRAEKRGRARWPDHRGRSGTAPSPSTATMVQPRSTASISRSAFCPQGAPPSRRPLRRRSQIPISRPRARHQRATPARGFLHRGFSDACRPSARHRSSAAGVQEALTIPVIHTALETTGPTCTRPQRGLWLNTLPAAALRNRDLRRDTWRFMDGNPPERAIRELCRPLTDRAAGEDFL